jgi:hypothetical protein
MRENVIDRVFTRANDPADSNFSRLRGQQIVDKLLRCYPDYAPNIKRAHDRLKNDPGYGRAMHRAAESLYEGRIHAFVSYRIGVDTEAARAVADVLRELSSQKVTVTLADEFTARISGQDFKSEIESSIQSAHWFIFLMSDAREVSEWCMYEMGMFRASATSKRMERLICIHHPTATPPKIIGELQAVPSTLKDLQRFLGGVLRNVDPLPGWNPLNPQLKDEQIEAAAERIERAFRPPRKPVSFNCRVILEINNPGRLRRWEELASCQIEADRLAADLFGKVQPPSTWGELVSNVLDRAGSQRWVEELYAVIKEAVRGNVFRPISSTFESGHGGRVVRPVLHAMEHDGVSDEYKFHLYFLDDISSPRVQDVPERTLALLTAVRMHNRVRWEVLHRFSDVEWTNSSIDACAKAFSRIEREVQMLGSSDVSELGENYGEDVRLELVALMERWHALRDPRKGELTLALNRRDVADIARYISECADLNRRFFGLTLPVLGEINSAAP